MRVLRTGAGNGLGKAPYKRHSLPVRWSILPLMPPRRTFVAIALAAILFLPLRSPAAAVSSPGAPVAPLTIDGLGKGVAPLAGPWQFHLGDDPAWAAPGVDDATGHNGWEQLTAAASWGTQGHPSYTGYGWYRRQLNLTPAPGASPDVSLLIPQIDDVYQVYWNGVPVGHLGNFPPRMDPLFVPPQIYSLGPARSGVLAVRVFKLPSMSTDDGSAGGFEGLPLVGSPEAIATGKEANRYHWLGDRQFLFGLTLLYGLASLLSFTAWLRDRKQWLLFWLAVYTLMPILEQVLTGLGLPIPGTWLTWIAQTVIGIREICQWFLLIYLLQLDRFPRLVRLVRIGAWIGLLVGCLDGALAFALHFGSPAVPIQIADAVLTAFILPLELVPMILVIYAIVRRQRLDSARWLVAILALLSGTWYSFSNIVDQGTRFTHWTLGAKMQNTIFTVFGSSITVQLLLRTLLFLAIVYAVIRYSIAHQKRQTNLERSSRTLANCNRSWSRRLCRRSRIHPDQRLSSRAGGRRRLLPDHSPRRRAAGFDPHRAGRRQRQRTQSSDVRVAHHRRRPHAGQVRTPAFPDAGRNQSTSAWPPAERFRHLHRVAPESGRILQSLQCRASRPLSQRAERWSCPGHSPRPRYHDRTYQQVEVQLKEGDHFSLYTDGLLEARNHSGELYGFERLRYCSARGPARPEPPKKQWRSARRMTSPC